MTRMNIDLITVCANLNNAIKEAQKSLDEYLQPVLTNKSLIPTIHNILEPIVKGKGSGYGIRAEIMVMLYLYAPQRIWLNEKGKYIKHDGLQKDIADAIGLKQPDITRYRNTLLDYYRLYRPFRELVDKCVSAVLLQLKQNGVLE